jgi:hypothetical protein
MEDFSALIINPEVFPKIRSSIPSGEKKYIINKGKVANSTRSTLQIKMKISPLGC